MPISRPDTIPVVGSIIWGKSPKSILDIGVGFGLWGVLFRAWTDIRMSEITPSRYHKWKTIIDGIEIFPDYVNKCWEIYDTVWVGDAIQLLEAMHDGKRYDHIHLGDVIEHMDKDAGVHLMCLAAAHLTPGGSMTVVTPDGFRPQGVVLGNKHEEHKCGWTTGDLAQAGASHVWTAGSQLVAAFQS